jgi:carbon storage regulator
MLILTRKAGQSVVIGNSVRVTVLEVSPGSVRLGFDASSDVSIYRDEIYEEIAAANRAAMEGSPPGSEDGLLHDEL